MSDNTTNPFSGEWMYRSFLNLPDRLKDGAPLGAILFGQGDLRLEDDGRGGFDGSILSFGPAYRMSVSGKWEPGGGDAPAISLRAVGEPGAKTDGWIYDYSGHLAKTWPDGVDQRAAIVGTVIRVVPHSGKPAGVVASFVAVRRD